MFQGFQMLNQGYLPICKEAAQRATEKAQSITEILFTAM